MVQRLVRSLLKPSDHVIQQALYPVAEATHTLQHNLELGGVLALQGLALVLGVLAAAADGGRVGGGGHDR